MSRFVVWDPTGAAPGLAALGDATYGNWSFQGVLGAGAGRGARAATLAGLQLALRFCAFAFREAAVLLLNLDLDEFLSCDFFADGGARRSVAAAVAAANDRPWFRGRPRPCVCFPRVLYNGTAGRAPVGLQRNRKCVAAPAAALTRVSLHAPRCRGSTIHVDHGDACRVAHRRAWTGEVRPGRPVDDGVALAGAAPAADVDWWDFDRGAPRAPR